MKTYEEMTSSVLKKIHEQDTRQKKRRTMILRTAAPVCGAFAVTGALVLSQLKQPALTSDSSAIANDSEIIAGGGIDGGEHGGLFEGAYSSSGIGQPIDSSESDSFATSQGTPSAFKPEWENIKYNRSPENLSPSRKVGNYNFEKLSPEEAKKYYDINIFTLEDYFDGKNEYSEFSIQKDGDKIVDDGNFVQFNFSDSSEYVLALFRKETKWVPEKEYETEDFAGMEITFFKDDVEIKAIFEVNGTQITLLYNGTDMKKLFNVIKVFSASELRENSDPILTGGGAIACGYEEGELRGYYTDGTN